MSDPETHRLGKFSIPDMFMESATKMLADIFAECKILPVQVERRFDTRTFEYTAYCDHFDEIETYWVAPRYDLILEQVEMEKDNPEDEDQFETVFKEFKRIKQS